MGENGFDPILTTALNKLIGYGNPSKSRILFFGLEEKGEIGDYEPERREFIIERAPKDDNYFVLKVEELYRLHPHLKESDLKISKSSKIYKAINLINDYVFPENRIVSFSEIGDSRKFVFLGNFFPCPQVRHNLKMTLESDRSLLISKFLNAFFYNSTIPKVLVTFGEREAMRDFLEQTSRIEFQSQKDLVMGRSDQYYELNGKNYQILLLNHPSLGWLSLSQQTQIAKKIVNYLK